jgi:hypothetical protein
MKINTFYKKFLRIFKKFKKFKKGDENYAI